MQTKPKWVLLATLVAVSSCSGGNSGGSGVPVVTAPTPTPTPSPTPAPTPTPSASPVSLSFSSPSVGVAFDTSGAAQVYPAVGGSDGGSVVVSDPDAPAAVSFENLRLTGNETFKVSRTQSGSSYSASFLAANSTANQTVSFYASGADQTPRSVSLLTWSNGMTGSASAQLHVVQTQAEATALPDPPASYYPAHARLLETILSDRAGLQIFGSATALAAWPKTNGLEYVGEIYGTVYTAAKQKLPFVGDATIYVDGANANAQIHGIITVSHYQGQGNQGLPIEIDVVADIVGNTIVNRQLNVIGAGGAVQYGSVTGSFYGESGNELGLVLSASGDPGSLIGGLIVRLRKL